MLSLSNGMRAIGCLSLMYFLFYFLVVLRGLWDLNYLTEDKRQVLTAGLPENFL